MNMQVYNLENIRNRYSISKGYDNSVHMLKQIDKILTYPQINEMGWRIVVQRKHYDGTGLGITTGIERQTEYVIADPEVTKWLEDNNIKVRKSNISIEETYNGL